VLLIGISVSLYFFAPEEHTLSFSIGGGAGAVLGLSLLLKTLLWLIPWLALGGVAIAIAILIYELYLKFHSDTASGVARKLDAMLAEPAGRGGDRALIETIHVRKIGNLYSPGRRRRRERRRRSRTTDERLDAVGKLIDRMLARGFVLADSVGITTDEPLPVAARRRMKPSRGRSIRRSLMAARSIFPAVAPGGGDWSEPRVASSVSSWSF
jgi:hypothetical protein